MIAFAKPLKRIRCSCSFQQPEDQAARVVETPDAGRRKRSSLFHQSSGPGIFRVWRWQGAAASYRMDRQPGIWAVVENNFQILVHLKALVGLSKAQTEFGDEWLL